MRTELLTPRRGRTSRYRGAVAVEFAAVAPLFVIIVLGLSQTSQFFDARNLLSTAAREGARMAAMDREGLVTEGQSTNDVVKQNIKNYLTSSGVDTKNLEVKIVHHDKPSKTFDLDDPENDFKLFEVRLSLPYSQGMAGMEQFSLNSKVVFRNAQATIAQ